MALQQAYDKGDVHPVPLEYLKTTSSSCISEGSKRSITPRGPLFPNLGEAHRNITSRQAPNNPFRKFSDESRSATDIPLQELPRVISPDGHTPSRSPGALGRHVSGFVSPYPSRPMAGRCLTDRQSIGRHSKTGQPQDSALPSLAFDNCNITPANAQSPDITGSTVSHIVEQYAATNDDYFSPGLAKSEPSYTFEPPGFRRGASTQLNSHGAEDSITSQAAETDHLVMGTLSRSQLPIELPIEFNDINKAPRTNNLTVPVTFEDDCLRSNSRQKRQLSMLFELNQSLNSSELNTTGSPDRARREEAESDQVFDHGWSPIHRLMPRPLRIPSNQRRKAASEPWEDPFTSDRDVSLATGVIDVSNESHDDPFKYDNDHYRRVRQLGKEREISCALRRLSHTNTLSEIMHLSPGKSSMREDSLHNNHGGHHGNSFFDVAAFHALHGGSPADVEADVKVIINRNPRPPADQEHGNANQNHFGLFVGTAHRKSGRSPGDQATEGDWVTEATSEADIEACVHNGPFTHSVKATGSSIADYSDDACTERFPVLSLRAHTLQRTVKAADDYEGHHLIQGGKRSAAPLRPQALQLCGPRPEVSRFATNLSSSTSSQTGIFNPFRRDYKRADDNCYFKYKPNRSARSKYEFRDSTSTYAPHFEGSKIACGTYGTLPSSSGVSINTAELLDEIAHCDSRHRISNGEKAERHNHKCDDDLGQDMLDAPIISHHSYSALTSDEETQASFFAAADGSQGPASTSSKFSFKLLDLSEAQELHRIRRESDDVNRTHSVIKNQRSISESSARAHMPSMPRPSAAYVRRDSHTRQGSRLSATFTPPPWHGFKVDGNSVSGGIETQSSPNATGSCMSRRDQDASLTGKYQRLLPLDKRVRTKASKRTLQNTINRDITAGRAAEDHKVSYRAKSRRQLFFYLMLFLSILPFFAILVLNGNFDNSLSWATHGEVYRLTKKQRRIVKMVFIAECIIYASLVAAIIAYYVTESKAYH